MARTGIALVLLSILSACGEPQPATPAEPAERTERRAEPAPVPGPQSGTPLPEQMQEHFTEATEVRQALVRGDLATAKARAAALASAPASPTMPTTWTPFFARMQAAARQVGDAPDLDQAGLRFGALANVCADCHRSLGAHPSLDTVAAPTGTTTPEHMQRHQWALDRMWEGLMAPADDRFTAGAGALAEAPLHPSAIAPNQTVPENLRALSDRTHTLGSNASRATEPAQRAQLYGELLTTCHGCHSALEAAPGP